MDKPKIHAKSFENGSNAFVMNLWQFPWMYMHLCIYKPNVKSYFLANVSKCDWSWQLNCAQQQQQHQQQQNTTANEWYLPGLSHILDTKESPHCNTVCKLSLFSKWNDTHWDMKLREKNEINYHSNSIVHVYGMANGYQTTASQMKMKIKTKANETTTCSAIQYARQIWPQWLIRQSWKCL